MGAKIRGPTDGFSLSGLGSTSHCCAARQSMGRATIVGFEMDMNTVVVGLPDT